MESTPKPKPETASRHAAASEDVLMRLLLHKASTRQETLKQLSRYLGISYERLSQLRARSHPFAHTSRQVLGKVSAYLEIPTVLVMAHAGQIRLEDFAWPQPSTSRVTDALHSLRSDPIYGAFVPQELDGAHPAVQLLVVFLYERLTTEPRGGWRTAAWLTELESAIASVGRNAPEPDGVRSNRSLLFP
jgi:hypothetical protein